MRKSLCIFVIISIVLVLASPVLAVDNYYSNGYGYQLLDDGTIYLVRMPSASNKKTYTVPSSIDGFKVSAVSSQALEFISNEKIVFSEGIEALWGSIGFYNTKELVFPSSMKIIVSEDITAFPEAWALEKITIDSKNPIYGVKDNFIYNKLSKTLLYYPVAAKKKSITTPTGIEVIQQQCFTKLKYVESVTVSEGVLTINPYAFMNCEKLKSANLPSTLNCESFENVFNGCPNITSITVSKKNPHLKVSDGALVNIDTSSILYMPPQSKVSDYNVSDDIKVIKSYAFSSCSNIESVHIPGTVEIIEAFAFSMCTKLKNLVIDEGVRYISEDAFNKCPHLIQVPYPQSADIYSVLPFQ